MSDAFVDELWAEPDTGLFVVDEDAVVGSREEALRLVEGDERATVEQGLTVARQAGKDDLWPRATRRALTWCIDKASFGRDAAAVVRAMGAATADWEASANVRFVHSSAEDSRCTRANGRVVFDVRRVAGRSYLARAFFPSQPRTSRELLVDQTALPPPPPLTLEGVLRHELGHALGLRHEHTRLRSNRCYEDGSWRAVTPYDVRSVMHYPQCAGVTGRDLVLTASDRRGIARLYP